MKSVIKTVWLFYSIIITAVIVMLFLLPGDQLLNKTPVCGSIASSGTECFACGMTRGFVSISEMDINSALAANEGSLVLFGMFVLNTLLFITYITVVINKKYYQYRRGIKWEKAV